VLVMASESTDSKSFIQRSSQGPARQMDPTFVPFGLFCQLSALRMKLSSNGYQQADQEAKRGSMLPQSSAPMDLTSATEALKRHQRSITEDRYLSDPHARVHRASTGSQHYYQRWQRDWSRDQCVTVAQVLTGHFPLAAAYLHCIGHLPTLSRHRRNSRASGVSMFGPQSGQEGHVARRSLYNRSVMPLELPGLDCGSDPPFQPGMRERERTVQ